MKHTGFPSAEANSLPMDCTINHLRKAGGSWILPDRWDTENGLKEMRCSPKACPDDINFPI